jgi:hypothetical protein
MKQEFYDAYELLYQQFIFEDRFGPERKTFDEYHVLRIIRKTINELTTEKPLRPDAKYFLIVNFHFLIVKPLSHQNRRNRALLEELFPGLEEDIMSDISSIVILAEKESQDSEISGHSIMRSIDNLWSKLRTTRLEIWG